MDDMTVGEGQKKGLNYLRGQLYAAYSGDREKAAREIATLGAAGREILSDLETRLKDPSHGVRDAARVAIRSIKEVTPSIDPRPLWKDRKDYHRGAVLEFILTYYKAEIEAGNLTAAKLRRVDPSLYAALSNWQRRHELPSALQTLFPARRFIEKPASPSPQQADLFTLKPGIWGLSVDLKEAARRLQIWYARWRRKSK
jgi:hypothetical protein